MESCKDCKFWIPMNGRAHAFSEYETNGDCHRRAPVQNQMHPYWPSVGSHQWCGEFEQYVAPAPETNV